MNTATRPVILELLDLHFAYAAQPALVHGWSASIGPGVTLVHGDTGSGKTTLLRLIAGTLSAGGRLTLAGVRLDNDAAAYRRHVFFCDSTADAFEQVTARAWTVSLSAGDMGFSAARWRDLVSGFALAAHLDKPMYMLSTGSKRKVWLAAALASRCALILLDEPTGGLDAPSIDCLWNALGDMARRSDQAVIVASGERVERVPLAGLIALPLH